MKINKKDSILKFEVNIEEAQTIINALYARVDICDMSIIREYNKGIDESYWWNEKDKAQKLLDEIKKIK